MRQAPTQELYAYWNQLRRGRAAPERNDIDPAVIRGVLADTFMLEIDADLRFPLRLSGTRFNALFMSELKGMSFLDLWSEDEKRSVAATILTVIDGVCPVIAGVHAAPADRAPAELELLLLPLRHQGKTHARVLGCLTPTAHPSWLGLLPVAPLSLISLRIMDASTLPVRPGAGFTSPGAAQVANAANQRGIERRGHLRVYQGGR